jgi:hypothetical protein
MDQLSYEESSGRLHGIGSPCKSPEKCQVELEEVIEVTQQVIERTMASPPALIGQYLPVMAQESMKGW